MIVELKILLDLILNLSLIVKTDRENFITNIYPKLKLKYQNY